MDGIISYILQIKQKITSRREKIGILFLTFALFYGFIVIIYCITSTERNYVPYPHFDKDTPLQFKQLFFMIPQDGEDTLFPINNDDIIFHGPRNTKKIALTFDADMTPWMKEQVVSGKVKSYYDQQLIETLEQSNTKATLFLTGMWIEVYPEEAKKLAANSLFEFGNHSYSHPSFSDYCYGLRSISPGGAQQEIEKTQHLLQNLTNTKNTLFRFPGGCYSQKDIALLHDKGIQGIQWDVVGGDGFNNNAKTIEYNVLNNVQSGSIIVMHMNGYPNDPKTSEALSMIITRLKEEGFTFVKVSELLNEKKSAQVSPIFVSRYNL